MAYPATFLTRTGFTRIRLRHTGGTEGDNINTQLNLFINLLNGTTSKDMLVSGSIGAKGVYPYSDATYSLGDATYGFTALSMDNGATDGGTIYFDGGTTSYLQSNAAGTTLSTAGFTSLSVPAIKVAGAETLKIWTYDQALIQTNITNGYVDITISAVTLAKIRSMSYAYKTAAGNNVYVYESVAAWQIDLSLNSTTVVRATFGANIEVNGRVFLTIIEAV